MPAGAVPREGDFTSAATFRSSIFTFLTYSNAVKDFELRDERQAPHYSMILPL
jgi:hypothetical protein